MKSARAQQFRDAVRTAREAAEFPPNDPFKQVLEDVAEGISDENVKAGVSQGLGGRLSLWTAPAYRPGRVVTMLVVVRRGTQVQLLLESPQVATDAEQFTEMLKSYITTPEFVASLQEISALSHESVEGFLRSRPGTLSLRDIVLEVSPKEQREIAENLGKDVSLRLPISQLPGLGNLDLDTDFKVLESAGFSVNLSQKVVQDESGKLVIAGRVSES